MKYATHYGIPEVIDDAVVVSLYTLYETLFSINQTKLMIAQTTSTPAVPAVAEQDSLKQKYNLINGKLIVVALLQLLQSLQIGFS